MRRRLFSVILVSFLALFSATAQEADEDSDWFWDKPISKIEFEGLDNVKKSDLSGITSTFIGMPFTEDVYTDLLDRLYAVDFFEDIESYAKHDSKKADSVLVVFKVREYPVISKISFSGNKKLRNSELREIIKNKATDIYVESKILMDERLLRDHYLEKGYSESKITHTIKNGTSGIEVVFVIQEGANTVISEIHTTGNTIVSERVLKSKLALKEVGLLRDGAFQNSVLEQDKRTIVSYYQERGYADANIVDVRLERSFNEEKQRNELVLTFVIQEGAQYTFGGLSVSGNEVFSSEELLSKMKLKKGAIFNEIKFQEGISAIMSLYYESGYMSNGFAPMAQKDNDSREISYTLYIQESVRSHVENIIVKGNSKTKDYVITREIPLEPGDVFSRDKIINGIRNLMNLQYFSSVLPDLQPGSEANLVDVVVSVEEQSTTALNFGMTFSPGTTPDEFPISLFAEIKNSNLFGEGKSVSANLTLSKNEQSFELSYSQNWIGSLPVAYTQSLSFSHTNTYAQTNMFLPDMTLDQYYYYMPYEGWSAALGTSFGRRWTPNFAILSLSGGLSNKLTNYVYDESIYTPTDYGISMFANRWGILNTLWGSFSIDGRDISYDPSKGWFVSERLAWNGLIPGLEKEFFLRSDTKLEGYFTAFDIPVTEKWNFKGVFAAYTGFSALFPLPGYPISESNRLYIDGMFNGRGWRELYKSSANKGQAMWTTQLEFRVPIVPGIIGVDLFHDSVVVKSSFADMFSSFSMDDMYFSFGPGVRFLIPQFPLHLLFAFRYQILDGQFKWADSPFQFVLSFNLTNR